MNQRQQIIVAGLGGFFVLLGLHYLTWYYDSVLAAMAGDRSDPEVAARHCDMHSADSSARQFWGALGRYGGTATVAGGGTTVPLERLDLEKILKHAERRLLSSDGLQAVEMARARTPDSVPPTIHQTFAPTYS